MRGDGVFFALSVILRSYNISNISLLGLPYYWFILHNIPVVSLFLCL